MFEIGDTVWFSDASENSEAKIVEGILQRRSHMHPGQNIWSVLTVDNTMQYYVPESLLELSNKVEA